MAHTQWSELDFIDFIGGQAGTKADPDLIQGIGDDCAIFAGKGDSHWVISSDMLVENIHFKLAWHPPELLGRKSIAVNLSDIAAMGAVPRYALISIALPDYLDASWIKRWTSGVLQILDEFDCCLIGGDTVRGPNLVINVTMLGSVEPNLAILRSGARAGEHIYVSGFLGSAGAGLAICSDSAPFGALDQHELEPLIERHLNPTPEVALGRLLAKSGMVGAMQDLSDGLATDLAHICAQSSLGAEVEALLLPGHDALPAVCRVLNRDPVELKISSGEDYHLIFTVRHGKDEELQMLLKASGDYRIFRIGCTVEGRGVSLLTEQGAVDVSYQGYQHHGHKG